MQKIDTDYKWLTNLQNLGCTFRDAQNRDVGVLISSLIWILFLQVDFVIRESRSVDNLSQMYEGWTAWV